MYIEASKECNILDFNLAGTVNSKWDIRIIQLHCNSNSLAPVDCTQYYFGQTSGTIHSFNFNGGLHLAEQNQLICIRKEIQMCRICYSTAMGNEDFDISGTIASMAMVGYKVNTLKFYIRFYKISLNFLINIFSSNFIFYFRQCVVDMV